MRSSMGYLFLKTAFSCVATGDTMAVGNNTAASSVKILT